MERKALFFALFSLFFFLCSFILLFFLCSFFYVLFSLFFFLLFFLCSFFSAPSTSPCRHISNICSAPAPFNALPIPGVCSPRIHTSFLCPLLSTFPFYPLSPPFLFFFISSFFDVPILNGELGRRATMKLKACRTVKVGTK